jgi:muramoyltetrapeptide carboxypeptidase LdcA involved in peptidoglycan recycling
MTSPTKQQTPVGLVYTSGAMRVGSEEVLNRLNILRTLGLSVRSFQPETPSVDGYSSGSDMDRAMCLAHALTLRVAPTLWAARGGYGSTAMFSYLESLLPPVLPDTTLIGYSDV